MEQLKLQLLKILFNYLLVILKGKINDPLAHRKFLGRLMRIREQAYIFTRVEERQLDDKSGSSFAKRFWPGSLVTIQDLASILDIQFRTSNDNLSVLLRSKVSGHLPFSFFFNLNFHFISSTYSNRITISSYRVQAKDRQYLKIAKELFQQRIMGNYIEYSSKIIQHR